ncbi:MAG: YggS family pyridoxal phosphate-dependent enzyme [Candidatus Nanopelagicales bacterium]
MTDARTGEIQANLEDVRARIARACEAVGRDPGEITLIVVTKTWPVEDVERLAALGVHDVGENRDQEASVKVAATRGLGLRWHFVGQLQTNKAASVAGYASLVHSVDRTSLVGALEKGAARADRTLDCLVQVNLAPDTGGRGGTPAAMAGEIAAAIAQAPHLRLRGVMGVAPLDGDAAGAFATLAEVLAQLREQYPDLDVMSAGMSDDLDEAVAAGATHLRVGSAILGRRPLRR